MIPLVPQLSPSGYDHVVTATPEFEPEVLALPVGYQLNGTVQCETGTSTLIGGRLKFGPSVGDLFLGLNSKDGGAVKYSNLHFGFRLLKDGVVIAEREWPEPGIRWVSSDQPFSRVVRLHYEPDTTYDLVLWADDHGHFEALYHLRTPPLQPPEVEE